MRRLAAGMGVGVRSMPTGSVGWGGLMLQDPNTTPMNPKEISLMTHPDVSMKMYDMDINQYEIELFLFNSITRNNLTECKRIINIK